jgi:hypothetical protein
MWCLTVLKDPTVQVTRFIVGGAHLMLPGVRPPPGGFASFKEGDVFAVLSPGNPVRVADVLACCHLPPQYMYYVRAYHPPPTVQDENVANRYNLR